MTKDPRTFKNKPSICKRCNKGYTKTGKYNFICDSCKKTTAKKRWGKKKK